MTLNGGQLTKSGIRTPWNKLGELQSTENDLEEPSSKPPSSTSEIIEGDLRTLRTSLDSLGQLMNTLAQFISTNSPPTILLSKRLLAALNDVEEKTKQSIHTLRLSIEHLGMPATSEMTQG